jgi:hypothetical protein
MGKKYKHLNFKDRCHISAMNMKGMPQKEIAEKLMLALQQYRESLGATGSLIMIVMILHMLACIFHEALYKIAINPLFI